MEIAMKNTIKVMIIFLIFSSGCDNKHKTFTYKTKPEFVNAYIDLLSLQERFNDLPSAYEDSALHILEKHNLTQLECQQIIDALNKKPERWEAFLQEVLNQLNSMDSTRIDKVTDQVKYFNKRAVK